MIDIEKIRQHSKNYYLKNKKVINEKQRTKITCEICGVKINKSNISHHKKSKKHIENVRKN